MGQQKMPIWISIHAPLTGSDRRTPFYCWPTGYFNPRSPYGERPKRRKKTMNENNFNPRSPYGERQGLVVFHLAPPLFQSTLPLRGATRASMPTSSPTGISIHAPLTGSDDGAGAGNQRDGDFNPRSPYGERHNLLIWTFRTWGFQSTLPLRGATREKQERLSNDRNFNPRSPYGERPIFGM